MTAGQGRYQVRPGSIGVGLAVAGTVLFGRVDAGGAVGLGASCGALPGRACDAGLYCDYAPGTCTMLGGAGTCVQIPITCPQKPDVALKVCGCNGTTYPNDCARIHARARKAHDGPCQ